MTQNRPTANDNLSKTKLFSLQGFTSFHVNTHFQSSSANPLIQKAKNPRLLLQVISASRRTIKVESLSPAKEFTTMPSVCCPLVPEVRHQSPHPIASKQL